MESSLRVDIGFTRAWKANGFKRQSNLLLSPLQKLLRRKRKGRRAEQVRYMFFGRPMKPEGIRELYGLGQEMEGKPNTFEHTDTDITQAHR